MCEAGILSTADRYSSRSFLPASACPLAPTLLPDLATAPNPQWTCLKMVQRGRGSQVSGLGFRVNLRVVGLLGQGNCQPSQVYIRSSYTANPRAIGAARHFR